MRRPRWVNPYVGIVVGGIAAMLVIGNVGRHHYNAPARDTRSGDVCFWMRNGHDVLTPGDWQRLGHFSSRGSLVLYVETHCPSQLAKVTS